MPGALADLEGTYTPLHAADWPTPPPRTIGEALDDIAAGDLPGTAPHDLVWASSGSPGPNVFTSWATLAPAIAALKGEKRISCQGSGLHVTAGTWPGITDVVFIAGGTTPLENEIVIDDGAIWTGCHSVRQEQVDFISENTQNLVTLAGTDELRWDLDALSENALSGPGVALVAIGGTSIMESVCSSGAWGAGSLSAQGGTVDLLMYNGSTLADDAFDASSTGGTVNVAYDASSSRLVSRTQSAGPAYTFVFEGLQNSEQAADNSGSPGATVTVTAPAILQLAGGLMDVVGTVSGTISGAGTVTAQLKRDATNIGSPSSVTLAGAGAFSLQAMFIDQAPDAAGHAYELAVTASAGNLTVNATSAQIKVKELA